MLQLLMQQTSQSPSPDPNHTVSPSSHPTPSHYQQTHAPTRKSIDYDESHRSTICNMQVVDRLPVILMAIEQGSSEPLELTEQKLTTAHSNTPSPSTQSNPTPATATATTHSTLPLLSAIVQMLLNNMHTYSTLWTPNALHHRRPTLTMETDQFTSHPDRVHSPSLIEPMTLTCSNNTLTDEHNTCTHTPAKTTPLPWLATCQCNLQHLLCTTLATNMKAFAQYMRPP